MARCMRLDDQDRAALRALDDFTISADGETAMVAGEMEIEVVRPADDGGDRFWLTIRLPSGEEFAVRVFRSALLEAPASMWTKKPDGGCSLKFSRL
jgi:hypothetical protein